MNRWKSTGGVCNKIPLYSTVECRGFSCHMPCGKALVLALAFEKATHSILCVDETAQSHTAVVVFDVELRTDGHHRHMAQKPWVKQVLKALHTRRMHNIFGERSLRLFRIT